MNARGPAWLFTPADRPDRLRTGALRADVVIADLEDAVAPARRAEARALLADAGLDPDGTIVRVNAVGTPDFAADLAAVTEAGLRTVMIPKAESAADVESAAGFEVIALCETPRGILAAPQIASAPGCIGLMWGSEDLAASLGAWVSRDESGLVPVLSWARAVVLAAARAAGVLAIDAVDTRIDDVDAVASEAAAAASAGYDAKACIHPSHIEPIRAAFRPPAALVQWAQRMLEFASGGSASALDGIMVDEAVLRTARRVSSRAEGR